MTLKPPDRNLTPEAQYWGRWVEQQLGDLQLSATAQGQATSMALAGINASIGKLSDQISAINTLQGQMATTISDLSTAQSNITTLLSDQIESVTATNFQSTTTVTTHPTYTNYAPITITVPAGYTQASVMAVTNFDTQGLSGGGMVVRTAISSNISTGISETGKLSTSHAATLTGLSGGGTFVVTSQAATTISATVAAIYVTTSAIVIFTK